MTTFHVRPMGIYFKEVLPSHGIVGVIRHDFWHLSNALGMRNVNGITFTSFTLLL